LIGSVSNAGVHTAEMENLILLLAMIRVDAEIARGALEECYIYLWASMPPALAWGTSGA